MDQNHSVNSYDNPWDVCQRYDETSDRKSLYFRNRTVGQSDVWAYWLQKDNGVPVPCAVPAHNLEKTDHGIFLAVVNNNCVHNETERSLVHGDFLQYQRIGILM